MPTNVAVAAAPPHHAGVAACRAYYLGGGRASDLVGEMVEAAQTNALHAFVAVAGEVATTEADRADRLIAQHGPRAFAARPLLGIPFSVKDLVQTADVPTQRGSLLPNPRTAADAPAVERLRRAGSVLLGKTATSEHGWSASTVSRLGPPTRNPWSSGRTAGGSSGGAAAAVAAGLGPIAIGTDGAGSIRIPASFCGVVGFKPSAGRIPYVPPCADGLAHIGPLARSVADIAELMPVLSGADPRDPDSLLATTPPAAADTALRIGWLEFPGTTSAVRRVSHRARDLLGELGHRVVPAPAPTALPYEALVDTLAAGEAAATRVVDEPWCDPGRLAIVRHGRSLAGSDLVRASEARLALRAALAELMTCFDLLAMATVPDEPFAVDAIAAPWAADPHDLLWLAWTPATYLFNVTGQPALSLPAGLSATGLPVGVQIVGRVGDDRRVLAVAGALEQHLGTAGVPPGATGGESS